MYEFLTSVAVFLVETINTYPQSCFVVKILVLLIILYKCQMLANFSSNTNNRFTIRSLLRNLAIKDDTSYQIINTDIFMHYQKSIGEVLDKLISSAVFTFSPPIEEWIFTVPLLHFTMKKCKPLEPLTGLSWDYDDCTRYAFCVYTYCVHDVIVVSSCMHNAYSFIFLHVLKFYICSIVTYIISLSYSKYP